MANIMNMVKLRNKPSRNGFDLSRKNLFTAKVGELLPVACIECLPGDSFDIDTAWFTRTQPVNTAAYTRIREYYDWYFVPTNLLWNKFNTFVTQMTDNNQKSTGINSNVVLSDEHPYFTTLQIGKYIHDQRSYTYTPSVGEPIEGRRNIFDFRRSDLTCKLLHYLGYGDFDTFNYKSDQWYDNYTVNLKLNPFKLLAYQKIYQDFFRDSQWEKAYAPACNIDYMSGAKGTNNLPISEIDMVNDNMFDLRYCNWNKDYFMGLLPNSQYGSVSSVMANPSDEIGKYFGANGNPLSGNATWSASSNGKSFLQDNNGQYAILSPVASNFSVLALRQAESLQKWREITQSQQQDYKSQIQAHFGEDVSEAYSDRCKYLGGIAGNLDIQAVQNTNLTGDNDANIGGRGEGGNRGTIKFSSPVHGYVMCIYHAVPLLEYAINGVKRDSLKTFATDYAIPEFDKTGMVQVPLLEVNCDYGVVNHEGPHNALLGYAPRYYDYKSSYDEIHGAFYDGGLDSWVAPLDRDYFLDFFNIAEAGWDYTLQMDYSFFKVPPAVLNPIFGVNVDSTSATDQFLINCSFDIKAVRNLDRNGLPY